MLSREGTGIEKPLLTAAEVRAATGLAAAKLYRWTAEGVFPAHLVLKIGRRIYYRRGLIAWLGGWPPLDGAAPGITTVTRDGGVSDPSRVEPLVPGGDTK